MYYMVAWHHVLHVASYHHHRDRHYEALRKYYDMDQLKLSYNGGLSAIDLKLSLQ